MSLSTSLTLYFLISLVLTLLVVQNKKQRQEEVGFLLIIFALLFSPIVVGIGGFMMLLFPPSGDIFDLVYTKLSFSEGKTAVQVHDEIKTAGQTIGGGWGEESLVEAVLETMVQQGFARRKEVPFADCLSSRLEQMMERYGAENEALQADLQSLKDSIADGIEDDDGEELNQVVYLRGNPPNKRGKWKRKFLLGLRPTMG